MKQKVKAEDALPVALELCERMKPFVERFSIAGSLRRGKDTVSDIEILFSPRMEIGQDDFFAPKPLSAMEPQFGVWLKEGLICKRHNALGLASWGSQNKLAIHMQSGIAVDFFATTPENWWVSLVIRTGGKDTNLKLATGARKLGRTLHAYGCGVEDLKTGEVWPATSEEQVFEMCGIPFLLPHQR
jgi:DNA polymerase/3'-5' exonuclease PolX